MARRRMPAPAGRTMGLSFALMALLLLPGAARAGKLMPELGASIGGTYAVLGTPNNGGTSASVSALWPVGGGLSFGVMLHGDDAGAVVDSLRDEQGRGTSPGMVEQAHRAAWGASWRLDAAGPALRGITPYASASWGVYRIADDLRGRKLGSFGSAGFSLGAGLRRPIGKHVLVGALARYHRLFNDYEGRFMSAGLECSWR